MVSSTAWFVSRRSDRTVRIRPLRSAPVHGRYVDWLLGWHDGFDPYLPATILSEITNR